MGAEETTVSDRGTVPIPADIRQHFDISAGDKLRWDIDDDGELHVRLANQREGVFDDFEPVDAGETAAVAIEDEFGAE